LGAPCEIWGFCILGILIACCYSAFGTFFGCARLCNCLCPIMGFLIYNTLLIKKKKKIFSTWCYKHQLALGESAIYVIYLLLLLFFIFIFLKKVQFSYVCYLCKLVASFLLQITFSCFFLLKVLCKYYPEVMITSPCFFSPEGSL
jgi:hypothetical protein